jgi:hypothetical protein
MLIGEAIAVDEAEHDRLMARVAADGVELTVATSGG